MRHNPAGASIVIMLRSLKLYGMANAVEDLVAQGAPAFEAATPLLSQLLKVEIAEREVRSIAYHTKVARFPAYKDLTGFDFASSEINEATVRQLHRCEFIEKLTKYATTTEILLFKKMLLSKLNSLLSYVPELNNPGNFDIEFISLLPALYLALAS